MDELNEVLFGLESDNVGEIVREYITNYVEYTAVAVIGVGVILGMAFLLKALFEFKLTGK